MMMTLSLFLSELSLKIYFLGVLRLITAALTQTLVQTMETVNVLTRLLSVAAEIGLKSGTRIKCLKITF